MSLTTATSTCNCGAISLSVTGVDKGAVLCHCSYCQRASGSAFAYNHRFMQAEKTYARGEELIREHRDGNTRSGKVLGRWFCKECGSSMFLTPEIPGLVILTCGTIDGAKVRPKMDLYPENKHEWVGDLAGKAKM